MFSYVFINCVIRFVQFTYTLLTFLPLLFGFFHFWTEETLNYTFLRFLPLTIEAVLALFLFVYVCDMFCPHYLDITDLSSNIFRFLPLSSTFGRKKPGRNTFFHFLPSVPEEIGFFRKKPNPGPDLIVSGHICLLLR